jgi:LacI family transcriptional regulator
MTRRVLRRHRARLEDVAVRAGVSKSIASRILNAAPELSVRPETRERVLAAARELHYRPHVGARGLTRAETGAIGLLIPNLTMPVYSRIVRGAVQRALERDFAVVLVEDLDDGATEASIDALVRSGRSDGLLIASVRPGHPLLPVLRHHALPHVFVNRSVPGSGRNATMADEKASEAAIDHLAALGHRRIGLIAGPPGNDPAERRAAGFVRRAAEVGLELAPLAEGDFTEQGGAELTRRILEEHPSLTALTAGGLSQAVGVLHAVWELGLRVPEDLSVVSFDDLSLAEYLRPPLTTVRMPLAELGAAAVDALLEQLGGGPPRDVVVETQPVVVVRGSAGSPRR